MAVGNPREALSAKGDFWKILQKELAINTVTATELSRNLQGVADRINALQEPLTVIKNSKPLFRVVPLESEVAQGLRELRESEGSSGTTLYHTPEEAIKALDNMV